jgi:ribonucleoside-diphosphate reductase alpha chain
MAAVKADGPWSLRFEERVARTLRARELWSRLCAASAQWAEPGVLFIDRINKFNNLGYCESLAVTSSCAEAPLPPHGACVLGAINLTPFVLDAFGSAARVDYTALRAVVRTAVRFLDNALEISRFPLFRQRQKAHESRRLGLGITGLGDALAMLRLRYDSQEGRSEAENIVTAIRDTAYAASVSLAAEKGAFPLLDGSKYLAQPYIRSLPEELRDAIRRDGIRNSHLLAFAPCNTISLLAGNVSSGIEPIFGLESFRRVRDSKGGHQNFHVSDFAYARWKASASRGDTLPDYLAAAGRCAASDHLLMQAILQPLVDGGISKSVPIEAEVSSSSVAELMQAAFDLGVKGCTVFRPNARAVALQRRGHQLAEPEALADELECTLNRASD